MLMRGQICSLAALTISESRYHDLFVTTTRLTKPTPFDFAFFLCDGEVETGAERLRASVSCEGTGAADLTNRSRPSDDEGARLLRHGKLRANNVAANAGTCCKESAFVIRITQSISVLIKYGFCREKTSLFRWHRGLLFSRKPNL